MKEIKLTQGKVAIVDDEDFEELNKFKWYAVKKGRTYYAERATYVDKKKSTIRLHQIILKPKPEYETDHKDRDGLHNWRDNLRYATRSQNVANIDKYRLSSSKKKGVSWHKGNNKWMASIWKEGTHFFLGYFFNEADAALAYDKSAIEFFGEFARTNYGGKISKQWRSTNASYSL